MNVEEEAVHSHSSLSFTVGYNTDCTVCLVLPSLRSLRSTLDSVDSHFGGLNQSNTLKD